MTSASEAIRFSDGAAYERFMGEWSLLVGGSFLEWLAPPPALRWLDVGCGNGAFTALLAERLEPLSIAGIDPSEQQLAYARARPNLREAQLLQADAMELPFAADAFDSAVMPLVLPFVPAPGQGVAEMARVVRPGGLVSAYIWDLGGGGFPYQQVREALNAWQIHTPDPPSPEASGLPVMEALWQDAALAEVRTCSIGVERTFADFAAFWAIVSAGPSVGQAIRAMQPDQQQVLQQQVQELLQTGADGSITVSGRANAIAGVVPRPQPC
ncbi:MAG: class I SAM-dependent methyltransferase [Prochlorococcaceae cyanobacterium]